MWLRYGETGTTIYGRWLSLSLWEELLGQCFCAIGLGGRQGKSGECVNSHEVWHPPVFDGNQPMTPNLTASPKRALGKVLPNLRAIYYEWALWGCKYWQQATWTQRIAWSTAEATQPKPSPRMCAFRSTPQKMPHLASKNLPLNENKWQSHL